MPKRYTLFLLMALGAVIADNSRVNTCVATITELVKLVHSNQEDAKN